MNTKELDQEFDRVVNLMIEQGRLEEIFDAIPYLVKEEIVRDYEAWEEEREAQADLMRKDEDTKFEK